VIGQGTLVVTLVVVAFGRSSGNCSEHETTVTGTVLLYLPAALLLAVAYARWHKQVICTLPHVTHL
jgi:hypothetical protein